MNYDVTSAEYLKEYKIRLTFENGKMGVVDFLPYTRRGGSFAKMILRHYRKIVNYFHHPISSGLAEGLNNLIATVKKKAYGYRNMEYFKLKIRQENLKPILLTHNDLR